MKDKELRKLIGSRAKQRRLELNLTQPYVAEKTDAWMNVTRFDMSPVYRETAQQGLYI